MGYLTWQPHEFVLVTQYLTTTRTEKVAIPTQVYADSAKVIDEEPPFVPGVFNIKNYSVSKTESKGQSGSLHYTWKRYDGAVFHQTINYTDGCRTNSLAGLTRTPPSYSAQEQLALQEALAKLNEAVWDAGVDLAEICGTFELIKDGLRLLASPKKLPDLIRNLRKTVPQGKHEYGWKDIKRDAQKGSEKAASLWLCYRYGVMPLILSIQDALEALEKQLEKAGKQIRTKRRRPDLPATKSEKRGSYAQTANYRYEWKPRIEAIAYYRRKTDQTLQQLLGLTPDRISEVLWETTTLSFVWDWFFNVGALLGSLRPKIGLEVLGSSVSNKIEGRLEVIQLFQTHDAKGWLAAKPFRVNIDTFKRTVTPGTAVPVFTGFDGMTLQRYIDAAALALKPSLKLLKKNASLFGRK